MRRHTDKHAVPCSLCNKAFPDRTSLKQHMLSHSGVKAHVCELCGKRVQTARSLAEHKRIHTGQTFLFFFFLIQLFVF
jgi:KRAB domain-containing zinc finger protein